MELNEWGLWALLMGSAFGAGVLNAGRENFQVRIGGAFGTLDELRALPIRAVNPATGVASAMRLGDIAGGGATRIDHH